jgi:hypothetical protein
MHAFSFWVSANKLIIDIAKQVLETTYRKLLTRLTSFWMKALQDWEKGDLSER